jgi:ABC-type phosphate transport system, periplasmic component
MKLTHFLLAAIILLFSGCSKNDAISGAGNSFSYPFYDVLLHNYYNRTGVKVEYDNTSTDFAMRAFHDKVVDFTAVYDIPQYHRLIHDDDIIYIPCMTGAIVLAYNLTGVDSLNLDAQAIAAIYSGKIKQWNHPLIAGLNPGLALDPVAIVPLHRVDEAASSLVLANYLGGHGVKMPYPLGGQGIRSDGAMASYVAANTGSIAYISIEQAVLRNMTMAAIATAEGDFITVGEQSVNIETGAYPMSVTCGALVYKDQRYNNRSAGKQSNLVAFMRHILSPDIQERVSLMGCVSLSYSGLAEANRAINSIRFANETNQRAE